MGKARGEGQLQRRKKEKGNVENVGDVSESQNAV